MDKIFLIIPVIFLLGIFSIYSFTFVHANNLNTSEKSEIRLFCEDKYESLEDSSQKDNVVMNCINSYYVQTMRTDNLDVEVRWQ